MASKLGCDIPCCVMTNGHMGFRSLGSS